MDFNCRYSCYHAPTIKTARHVDYYPECVLKCDAMRENVCRPKYFLQASLHPKRRKYFLCVLDAVTETACNRDYITEKVAENFKHSNTYTVFFYEFYVIFNRITETLFENCKNVCQ